MIIVGWMLGACLAFAPIGIRDIKESWRDFRVDRCVKEKLPEAKEAYKKLKEEAVGLMVYNTATSAGPLYYSSPKRMAQTKCERELYPSEFDYEN